MPLCSKWSVTLIEVSADTFFYIYVTMSYGKFSTKVTFNTIRRYVYIMVRQVSRVSFNFLTYHHSILFSTAKCKTKYHFRILRTIDTLILLVVHNIENAVSDTNFTSDLRELTHTFYQHQFHVHASYLLSSLPSTQFFIVLNFQDQYPILL